MLFRYAAMLWACLIGFSGLVQAGLQEGREAYERGDYVKARAELEPMAEGGSARAQYLLGSLHYEGLLPNADPADGVYWFRKAAEAGFPQAQYAMGLAYLQGRGLGQSYREAAKWFVQAADKDNAEACFQLGLLHGAGNGVSQNPAESARYMARAAEAGMVEAINNLGIAYDLGQGVRHSDEVAYALYNLAGSHKDNPSASALQNLRAVLERLDQDGIRKGEALLKDLRAGSKLQERIDRFLTKQGESK